MKRWISIKANLIWAPAFLFFLIVIWEFISRAANIPNYILPAPSVIIKALIDNYSLLISHARITLFAAVVGLLIAIFVAVIIAIAMDRIKLLKTVLYPLLVISQTVPIIALAPILMIWFGLGVLPKIIVVALVCFFPIAVNIIDGLENVDKELIDLLKIMGAGRGRIFTTVQVPSVLPDFFSGLKIAVTYSIMAAVIGEWLGGKSGLGIYMTRAMHSYSTDNLFAAILMVVIISIAFFMVVKFIAWIFMPWKRQENESEG